MRVLHFLLIPATLLAQSGPRVQLSHTTEDLRGVSAVSRQIAWASGTHGTYLRTTDGGRTWTPDQVPGAEALDFRAVVAFSADEAFLMSIGPGDHSRIYHTADAGQHWQLQFTATHPKAFFDSMVFWDRRHGVVVGDPIPDESPKEGSQDASTTAESRDAPAKQLKFELLLTDDGQTWRQIPPSQLPPAIEGEGTFAASNTCIAILQSALVIASPQSSVILSGADSRAQSENLRSRRIPTPPTLPISSLGILSDGVEPSKSAASRLTRMPGSSWKSGASAPREAARNEGASAPESPDPNLWFATGGPVARVFHSPDRGQTWQVFDTPIVHGSDSAGIFSIAFRDPLHGVIAGGDYKHPDQDGPNLAFTDDGGKTWTLSPIHPQAFFSSAAYARAVNDEAARQQAAQTKAESEGKRIRVKPAAPQRVFLVGHDFIFDFRPPANPRRVSGKKKLGLAFNAASPFPEGGALIVGPKGTIAVIP